MKTTHIEVVAEPLKPDTADGAAYRNFVRLHPSYPLSQSIPKQMLLGRLLDGRLRIVEAISVRFSHEEGQVIAEAPELGECGFGANRSEALSDLQRTIAELYFGLSDSQDRLGPELRQVWSVIEKKIARRA
jgi:hypothetical protein